MAKKTSAGAAAVKNPARVPATATPGRATVNKAVSVKKTGVKATTKTVAPKSASSAQPVKSAVAAKPVQKKADPIPASGAASTARAQPVAARKTAAAAPAKSKPAPKAAEPSRKFVTTSKPESIAASSGKTKTSGGLPPGLENGVTMQDGRYALPAAVRIELPHTYKPSSKEEYMGPRHLQYFRNKLSQWREDLVEESRQTIESLRDEVRDVGDEAERATRETENSLELRTRDRYRKLIAKIDKALKRIEEGHYGFCEETDEEIGLDRLEARPIATLSLDAQERWEHRQKQMGD